MWYNGEFKPNWHSYNGKFYYKGAFNGKNCYEIQRKEFTFAVDLTKISDDFSVGFSFGTAHSFFKSKEDLVQIDFMIECKFS